ncbi:MAG: hypothetical protein WA857_02175 [Candidatus Acidiferrum sp.]
MRGGGYGGSNGCSVSVDSRAADNILAPSRWETSVGSGNTKITLVINTRLFSLRQDIAQLHIPIFPWCWHSIGISSAVALFEELCPIFIFECIMPIGHMPPLQQSITLLPCAAAHAAASIGIQSIKAPIRHTHAPKTLREAR